MRFTLRQLEYFVAAGETGSITLASERINISQPSISTAISHLEKELGVQLFVRHHALGLSLTPAGRSLLREAKNVLNQAEQLYSVASDVDGQVRGQITVGCLVTLAPMVMPELAHSFTTAFPDTQIRHIELNQEQLLEGLRCAEIDVVITYDLQLPSGIAFTPLAQLPVHVVVSENHRFASRSAVSLTELIDEPLLLLDLPLSREYFLALFMGEGFEPRIGGRSAYQDVIRTMVANGYGYTLANVRPRSDTALDGRKVVRVKLVGEYRPMVIGVATLAQLTKSRLIETFQAHCQALISEDYIPGMVAPGVDHPLSGKK
ncbi:DNA-binding transcriptional regulator, LysR family [Tardiphaga sp. OK246]|jgi:DNA-binding transcriptional LysR family regulator|uniref:LysR substrate-binding domain-containing protein n=1 Tax=Tardiphaga sp. OK246 TaxID=1855307 RepID=UPI000B6DE2D6|nr:LysR substrate-binding domain-containing protein [Tardiphaga sp. OK246]SNT52084.1 DNA-binding transcriptional regulator, LysR family [Tardiphaga sp. OK246]